MLIYRDGLDLEIIKAPKALVKEGHACEVFKTKDQTYWFVTLQNTFFCAHGNTFREAVLAAKEKQNPGKSKKDAISRIKKTKKVTLSDFCSATGACRVGALVWINKQNLTPKTKLSLAKTLNLLQKSSSSEWADRLKKALKA